jgi:Stress responsive A/B Barrel Domain
VAGVLDHYVALKARPGQEQALGAMLDRFAGTISGRLDCVLDIAAGANINKSGLAQGCTHGCHARLTDPASLTGSYWNHPAHQELLAQIDAACAGRFAIDFTREE